MDLQFLIMTLLSPEDICRLGATSRYWRELVRDPILWRYFLLRDMPYWSSIDHLTMPQLEMLNAPIINEDESLVEGEDEGMESKCDYMTEWVSLSAFQCRGRLDTTLLPVVTVWSICACNRYLRGCPSCRHQWLPSRPAYERVTSFLQSLVPSSEPRYAMFGPGMEQLDVSLVTRLMLAPDVLPVSGTPHRQINGEIPGINLFSESQTLNNTLLLLEFECFIPKVYY